MSTGVTGYGVNSVGFYAKPLAIIDDEVDQGLRNILGESAGTDVDGKIPTRSMAGQLKSLIVDLLAANWDALEAAYSAVDPNKNSGASQDAVGSLSGVIRLGAQFSVSTGICGGAPLTSLPAGRVAIVAGTGSRFASLNDAALSIATGWVASSTYAVGDIRGKLGFLYRCITAGTSNNGVSPSGVGTAISDGTAQWRYVGQGTGFAAVPFAAETAGEIGALAGTMTGIATPVDGWNTIINPLDAATGREKETDSAYRRRREQALSAVGNTTVDAIRANILAVNQGSTDANHQPPTAVKVLFNDTDVTNSDGLPPHSVEVIVLGGTDADIEEALWESVGAGTYMHGSTVSSVLDSEGNSQTVRYSRPTEIPIWVIATAKYNQSEWPANSDSVVAQAVLSALLTYTDGWEAGVDVRMSPLMGAMMRGPSETDDDGLAVVPANEDADPVPGLLEIETLYFGIATGPSGSSQVSISSREIATFSSSNMDITASAEEA